MAAVRNPRATGLRPADAGGPLGPGDTVELLVGGMTCASCAARVQRRLNKLPGVDASVNYATERATVSLFEASAPAPGAVDVADLVREVEAAGYSAAQLVAPRAGQGVRTLADDPDAPTVDAIEQAEAVEATETRRSWTRVWVSAALAVPVIVLAMVPPAQFPGWQWLSLALAAPVVGWAAWPFHRAAWRTCGTARPRWTPWSRWARWPRSSGRCGPCSSAMPAGSGCGTASTCTPRAPTARLGSTSRSRRA